MEERFVIKYYDRFDKVVHVSNAMYSYPNEKFIQLKEPKGKLYEYAVVEPRYYKRR